MNTFSRVLAGLSILFFLGACANVPGGSFLQREKTKVTDVKWASFEDVDESFKDIKASISAGQKITTQDLDYRGFGPNTSNAHSFIYTKLEDLFIGPTGNRDRLPEDVSRCTQKKGNCYGLVKEISSERHEGKESLIERMTNKEETEITGWKFTIVFAIERRGDEEIAVAAYSQDENPQISRTEKGSDPRKSIIDKLLGGLSILF